MLLLNLNPSLAKFGNLHSLFQGFGTVKKLKYGIGNSHGFVTMMKGDDAEYAYRALDGSDLWDQHLSIRFVSSDEIPAEEVSGYASQLQSAKKSVPDKGQIKRKSEEEEDKEKTKRTKASASASEPFEDIDPSQSLLGTMFTSSSTMDPQEGFSGQLDNGGYQYDLIVIGGGSGGLAAAKEAAALGAKVACLDFVKPSPQGTTWAGLGGTCVNVGCIPKKLMHQAGLLGRAVEDARRFGWDCPKNSDISWKKLITGIQKEIGYRHFFHEAQLKQAKVDYINAYAEFVDSHKIQCTDIDGQVKEMTAEYFIVATGGRPTYPGIPGIKECCISSDDLFSLPYCPEKTLVIGASYVSLECAGFLGSLGLDVTVMVRSILLRGFDQQMAELIGSNMQNEGIKFIRPCVPTKIDVIRDATTSSSGRYKVFWVEHGAERIESFNTILVATGRDPCTSELHLEKVGVDVNANGFIMCSEDERTSCPYVFAVGDVVDGREKLAPVAIQGGKLLARRLFGGGTQLCDYSNIPTTVFTPLEYGCVGLSEEDAIAKYGAENIKVFHSNFTPLEWTVPRRDENACYAKLICVASENEKVVGLHVLGPNAGEMTQGWTIGIKLGATKSDFDNSIGIHPTCAEVFTTLSITKDSGLSAEASGC